MSEPEPERDEERVSLAPLDPETALRALLAVDPNDKDEEDENPSHEGDA